jgi:amino acid adenylation domain-containing protein
MDRSLELVIALLGVMKSGAAFVPLDTEWPFERLAQVLQELPGEVVLVSPAAPIDPAALGRNAILVDVRAPLSREDSPPSHERRSDPEAPIYAIYTSGSTGRPKAAVVPHRGITNRLLWMSEFFGSAAGQVVLQTTRPVYDSAIWQLFWPLLTGGRTVLPEPGREHEAEYLAALIDRHGVTMTDFVPSVFNALVPALVADDAARRQLRSLHCLIVGGEEITPTTTYRFQEHFPDVRLVNLYGPTECSIGCIAYEVTGREGGRIPIGRPISNVQALVLDHHGHPVPPGVPGELFLTGACLGLGYLGDVAQTRAAFVPNPVAETAAPLLYRTGDLVRYRADGNIEFLGRKDRQIKLRGYRIELGEIEAVLEEHSGVLDAAAIVREDQPGQRRLVAYVVASNGTARSASRELRAYLQRRLPEHMVPSAIVALDALPLAPSGKVDHRALPSPEPAPLERESAFEAPRTKLERAIAAIWAGVLGVDRVGLHDNFFDLGGHSLLATQMAARIHETLGIKLPLRSLFDEPTVAGVVARVRAAEDALARLVTEIEALTVTGGGAQP